MIMKQIVIIEELQDSIALGKEIYEVDSYKNDNGELIFFVKV